MSRIKSLFVCLCLLLLSVPAQAGAIDSGEDTLVYSWSSNVGPLNPHLYSPNQMMGQNLLYEPLVRYGHGGVIEPCLASSWDISDDGRHYTFHLRTDVHFTDGTPFDAWAVKKNFDAVLINSERHGWLELVNQLHRTETEGGEAVTVVDDHTVRLNLPGPYYPLLQELALVRPMRFISPASIPADGDTAKGIKAPVGTGPWKVVKLVRGEYDLFERNEDYWGEPAGKKHLLVKVIPDSNARAVAFDTGEIDLIYGAGGHGAGQLGLDTFLRYQQDPDMVTSVSEPLATRVLCLNSNRFPTNDQAVRQAILHAVNKPALVKHVFLGAEPQAETLFAPGMPYCNLGLTPYRFDTARAAHMLEQAGWTLPEGEKVREKDGRALALDLCFVGNDAMQKSVAEVLQSDLAQVGIRVNLVGEEADSFLSRQKSGEFGMIFGDTWGAPYDPHSFCSSMRAPSHADYQAQSGLPMKAEIDADISRVLVSVDETKRQALYAKILGTLHEQAVYLPLTYMTTIMVHRPEMGDVPFGATKNEIPLDAVGRD